MTENTGATEPEPEDTPDEDEWPEGVSPYDDGDHPDQETEVYDPDDDDEEETS
jgi:hypothetical protein